MENLLTPEQVKAARALLAWPQSQLASEARVALSTIADFERGARTPVANNAQAIRAALEAQGLQFYAGGVVNEAHLLPPPSQPRAGKIVRWIDATTLDQWADRRDAQSGMAELLRRLIYAQLGPGATVHFPSDESIQFPGWDGTCTSATATEFIPEGVSGWEIGTTRGSITAKASGDLANRLENSEGLDPEQTTFVFVTPRRFTRKKSWVKTNQEAGRWLGVRVIDADDLVHWLELLPGVAQWLAVRIGRRPDGIQNLEEAWEEWSKATTPPLAPSVLLVDRDAQAAETQKWVMSNPSVMSVQAESPQEAIAFLYGALNQFPENYRLAYMGRSLVATNQDVARQLVGVGMPLIVAISNPDPGLARRLSEGGHHVFAAYGPEMATGGDTVYLPKPWTHNLQAELMAAGHSEEKAHQYARACGRSITVLRRLLPSAAVQLPAWATQTRPELLAAMLAGSWVESSEVDRRVVSNLAGCSYEEFEQIIVPMAAALDGPLRRIGGVWKVVSLRDLWGLLARQLTPTVVTRFNTAFQEVLGNNNPRFGVHSKRTWFEEPGQYGPEASPALRRGLTEGMIAIGVYPQFVRGIPNASHHADQAIRQLLGNADAQLWWSLSGDFRRLAEASPRAFLESVHKALEGENPTLMSLFRCDEGPLLPREYLAELLWALEMLARSQEHLLPAALALARLAELDPPGERKLGNRPQASLREIFVCWAPQTCATLEKRLKAIDTIVKHHPKVGWKLLIGLAPHAHDILTPTPHPDWRDFSPEPEEVITPAALSRAYREIGKRLLQQVGNDVERWKSLFHLWMMFEPNWRDTAAEQLKVVVKEITAPEVTETIRDSIRELLQHHREFPDADWAKPEEELVPLDTIFRSLEPKSVEERHRWLFRSGFGVMRHGRSWEEAEAELHSARRAAAEELVSELSQEGLYKFAATIPHPGDLGTALAESGALNDFNLDLLRAGLGSKDESAFQLARGILHGLHREQGDGILNTLWCRAVEEGWSEQAELQIVGALPIEPDTWIRVGKRSPTLEQEYWKRLPVYRVQKGADLAQIVDQLIQVGKGTAAVHLLGIRLEDNPTADVLIRALKAAAREEHTSTSNDAVMFTHFLARILDYLEKDSNPDHSEIASLEWTYFQALRYSGRPPKVLFRALAENPDFFVGLIKCLYRPAEDSGIQDAPPENPELATKLASQAFDVLRDWTRVPGSDDSGTVLEAALDAWVEQARRMCKEAGRLEVGDSHIGQILAAATKSSGVPWPPEPIRNLIERVRSRAMERGFVLGIYNRRGVVSRAMFEGGKQERALANGYRRDAESIRFDHPRTAACLERLADMYERDGLENDNDAEHRDWL